MIKLFCHDVWFCCLIEQDDGLEKLEETVLSTKHIALAVNEELDLHTRLIVRFELLNHCVFLLSFPFNTPCLLYWRFCVLLQDNLDQHVDLTDSRLQVNLVYWIKMEQKLKLKTNGNTLGIYILLLILPVHSKFKLGLCVLDQHEMITLDNTACQDA